MLTIPQSSIPRGGLQQVWEAGEKRRKKQVSTEVGRNRHRAALRSSKCPYRGGHLRSVSLCLLVGRLSPRRSEARPVTWGGDSLSYTLATQGHLSCHPRNSWQPLSYKTYPMNHFQEPGVRKDPLASKSHEQWHLQAWIPSRPSSQAQSTNPALHAKDN